MAAGVLDGVAVVGSKSAPPAEMCSSPEPTEHVSLPAHSEVTIRLPDTNIATTTAGQSLEDALDTKEQPDVQLEQRASKASSEASDTEGTSINVCSEPEEAALGKEVDAQRASKLEGPQTDPEIIAPSADDSTITDRCVSSADTDLSEGSGAVDWDELERTEEQEPRDEGSDEVGWLPCPKRMQRVIRIR